MPDITKTSPAGYDRWDDYNGGAGIPIMTKAAGIFGLKAINTPKQKYFDDGVVGVAQLEQYCIVTFETGKAIVKGDPLSALNVIVMSRYNPSTNVLVLALPAQNVKPMLDKYRPLCDGTTSLDRLAPAELPTTDAA